MGEHGASAFRARRDLQVREGPIRRRDFAMTA